MPENHDVEELTIARFHEEVRAGQLTSRELTQWYLDRIAAHNVDGAAINAVVTVNPSALAEAEARDAAFSASGQLTGPLHGVPVLVKDQAETAGIPTSFGSAAFADYIPQADARDRAAPGRRSGHPREDRRVRFRGRLVLVLVAYRTHPQRVRPDT